MTRNPCYKCKIRFLGCHENCPVPERALYEEKRQATKDAIADTNKIDNDVWEAAAHRRRGIKPQW